MWSWKGLAGKVVVMRPYYHLIEPQSVSGLGYYFCGVWFPPTIFWLSPTLCSYREMALHLQLDQDAELEAATFLEMVVTASITMGPTESCNLFYKGHLFGSV